MLLQAEPVKPDLTKLSDAEAEALEPKEQAQRYKVRVIIIIRCASHKGCSARAQGAGVCATIGYSAVGYCGQYGSVEYCSNSDCSSIVLRQP